jgi:hypothetical protein
MTYDQHYTPEHISRQLSAIIIERYGMETTYVEPSEGNGSFSKHFPTVIGYDIDPVLDSTIKADFLDDYPTSRCLHRESTIWVQRPNGY